MSDPMTYTLDRIEQMNLAGTSIVLYVDEIARMVGEYRGDKERTTNNHINEVQDTRID